MYGPHGPGGFGGPHVGYGQPGPVGYAPALMGYGPPGPHGYHHGPHNDIVCCQIY